MANQAAKKQKAKNEKTLDFLKKVTLAIFGFSLFMRMVIFNSSFGFWSIVGLGVQLAIYWFTYAGLSSLAKVTYENGELADGGHDLGVGLSEYYFDLIYITWFIQVATLYSEKFWWLFLVIPGYAVFKLWGSVIKPWIFDSSAQNPMPEDEKTRKKREKAEKKAARGKFVTARR
eukprot:TRINITY_DN9580_c0_g1_i1.p1 TRINITY_DN9580_c0_g1~~TRINITY_DN9580_c0_g1_i1.p1  ORF type:complete len:181 (-),score=23.50 TRINITY_DN9580_c0_g1_i1:97-618(-)